MASNDQIFPATLESRRHDLGARVARVRLGQNLTQAGLAQEAGTSLRSVKRLEAGENASLDTLLRVLVALGFGDHLLNALPDPDIRPVERVGRGGRERQRARGRSAVPKATDWAWGDGEDDG